MSPMRQVLLVILLVLPGCAEDLDQYQAPAGAQVQAVFDPTGNPSLVPTPNDLMRDPVARRLAPVLPACASLKQGPYTSVTAGSTAPSAPAVKVGADGATRVTVSSSASSHLRFSAEEAGTYVIYMDVNAPLLLWDAKGKVLKLSSSEKGITGCSTLGARHLLSLPAKGEYWLTLAPTAKVTAIHLVLVQDTAQLEYNRYLSTLDGFPPDATSEMFFTGKVDLTTLTQTSVLGFDITTPSAPVRLTALVLDAATVSGGSAATGAERTRLRIWNSAGFSPRRRYAFFVVGGKDGVKAAPATTGGIGAPVIRAPLFQLTAGQRPLCAWDSQRAWDAASASCAAPASGAGTAQGCCTHNHAGLVASSVESAMRAREDLKSLTLIKRERAVKAAVLATATTLERIRQDNLSLLKVAAGAGVSADDVVLLWSFTTSSMNQAAFDPGAAQPVLPLPSHLLKDSVTGLLAVSPAAGASAADKEWVTYLNTLDGWPVETPATLTFSAGLDSASVGSKAVLVAELPASGAPSVETGTTVTYDDTAWGLSVARAGGWRRGSSYAVVALAGASGLKNKDTSLTSAPRRSPQMALALSPSPLCTWDRGRALDSSGACTAATGSLATGCCTKLLVSSFLDDPKASIGGKSALAKATALERIRQQYDALLQKLVSAKLVTRSDVVALWTFSTSSLAELTNGLKPEDAPWPNDLYRDSKTGMVALPAPATETAAAKTLRLGLNKLAGFSVQGHMLAGYTGNLDKASIIHGTSLLVFNLDTGLAMTNTLGLAMDAGTNTLAVVPSYPLAEETTYGVALVSNLTAGSVYSGGGLWDSAGKRVSASPMTAMVRAKAELFKNGKSTLAHLDDATAKTAETARLAAKPLFTLLDKLGLARLDVVGAWTFTTQPITATATRLRATAWKTLGKLDGLNPALTGALSPASTIPGAGGAVPITHIGGWVKAGSFTSLMVLDEPGGGTLLADTALAKAVSVPFIMTVPKGTAPAGGLPVVLFQHGFFRDRHDLLPLANSLAKAGLAAVAFDAVYHGARAWCTADTHCDAGTCDDKTGACKGGKLKADANGLPDASGARFLNTSDLFALRDNSYQNQVDAVALLRAILLGAEKGITGAGGEVRLDAKKVRYLGHSLGAMLGPLVLATDPLPGRAVLTAPGAPLSEVLFTSTTFSSNKAALLKAHGVTAKTAAALRLKAALQAVFDATDPGSFARYIRLAQLPDRTSTGGAYVSKKQLMVQLAGVDVTVPYALGSRLAGLAGLTTTEVYRSTYNNQGHSFLITPSPKGTAPATAAAQTQAATFLSTGTVCWPDTLTGKCQ